MQNPLTNSQGMSNLPPLIKMSSTYKMIVPAKVEEKIRYLIRKYPHTEWSGVLFIKHTGSFETNDLVITCEDIYPMDLGTSGWTEFRMSEDVTAYMADNIELFDCDLGLCHSHHSLGAFLSGQDLHTVRSEGNDTNCFVSLVVDTPGNYVAAITRKVKERKEITTKSLGSSYEFFGEGSVNINSLDVPTHTEVVDREVIEYFLLDVEREVVDNPFDFLDKRFSDIEARKEEARRQQPKVINSPREEDTEFFDWIHGNRKNELAPVKKNEKWTPDPTIIHTLICQIVTCSFIIDDNIDLKQWVVKHMEKKYKEIFDNDTELLDSWVNFVIEFMISKYMMLDLTIPDEYDFDATRYLIAKDMFDELNTYPSNEYLEYYKNELTAYTYE